MNGSKILNSYFPISYSALNNNVRKFSLNKILRHELPYDLKYGKAESSLWFTNLPNKRLRGIALANKKKTKVKTGPLPSGPLVIDCKNQEFNHYRGTSYKNFDVIPLASKGWHHRKSVGDHFTILPVSEHPAFLLSADEKVPLSFEKIGLYNTVIEELNKMNVHYPTVIQAKAMPAILKGQNVLVAAETGCGKTLAYLAPMVQNVLKWKMKAQIPIVNNAPLGVIILPTRELAIQVGNVAQKLCSDLGLQSLTLLGGHTKQLLLNPELKPVDILVVSLGVLMKTMTHNLFSLNLCKQIVVDEADTLLDDSFNETLLRLLRRSKLKFADPEMSQHFPNWAQLCFFSATMPTNFETLLDTVVPMEIFNKISTRYLHKILPHVPQLFKRVKKSGKSDALLQIVKKNVNENLPTMIFCNKTETCNWLSLFLNENGIESIRVNGKMSSEERLRQYQLFRDGRVDVISCTDVASRGLDCTRAKHIINYDFPKFMADYVHRCGRIGRIGYVNGCFITNFVASPTELDLVHNIEKAARTESKLHNVNNNITRIIKHRVLKKLES